VGLAPPIYSTNSPIKKTLLQHKPLALEERWGLNQLTQSLLRLFRRQESVAPADRRHHQMQRRMPRMAALFRQILGRLLRHANLNHVLIARVVFSIMSTQPALSFMNLKHGSLLSIKPLVELLQLKGRKGVRTVLI
jgi:hypothetical protein